ncbi:MULTISPECIES: lytic polysaccharide monooxygenase [Achromobacter]|uniref:Lytic polysaccharide monooxygenase n=1 Tax=Achromobacter spanius TaxID=217203 RepID=A0ABY8GSR3_9BURK|nr:MULTISPECIES: lytic polysaccharide monooxygenase [Achromobacter]WAI83146.1 lytic polysaccharide monooxygenase [Achromobacter spanius]WEX93230.1 lytic polysaccharide monooxygenase [Achromobacter sp. SS2-2022]WFP07614.1 lytic polysaccharide monooxygenase [Achromobacter spanius]
MAKFKLTLLGGLVLAAVSGSVLAHGTMSHPKARILHCHAGSQSEGCTAFKAQGGSVYDWREVWQKPGGEKTVATTPGDRLCDGGTKASHRGLNALAQWPITTLKPDANGNVTLKWNHTVAHRTKSLQFFITKMPYDSTKPLQFSDFEKFCEQRDFTPAVAGEGRDQEYSCTLPAGKTGRHLIMSVWNTNHVGDGVTSGESYRACGDVNIEGVSNVIKPSDIGALYSIGETKVGETLVWRLADPKRNGEYLEQLRVPLDENAVQGERWTQVLGNAVNGSSKRVRVGQLGADGKTVTPIVGVDKSHVYSMDGNKYHFVVTKEAADIKPDPVIIPPVSSITGPVNVQAGQKVTLSGSASTGTDLKFSWTVPAGISAAVKDQPTLSFVAPTLTKDQQYSFMLTTRNDKGASDVSHVVTVKGKPVVDEGGNGGTGGTGGTGDTPPAYKAGTAYKAHERVTNLGKVYECKPWPYTNWCGQSPFHYEPGKGGYWTQAWTLVK